MTAVDSDDQRESTDSASFSIPSLELSDGALTTGNSLDIEDGMSSTYSATGVEGGSPSVEAPTVKPDEALEAAGGVIPRDLTVMESVFSLSLIYPPDVQYKYDA